MKDILFSLFKIMDARRYVRFLRALGARERERLIVAFTAHETDVSGELKLKIHHVLSLFQKEVRRPFGILLVLGWQKKWKKKFAGFPDISQDIFRSSRVNAAEDSEERILEVLHKTVDFDGAVLVDTRGKFVASGVYLENMRPNEVATIVHSGSSVDLSTAFGFKKKVHMRHLAGIAASYILKGTTVFVISEEDRSMRVFEEGKIIWSTVKKEI